MNKLLLLATVISLFFFACKDTSTTTTGSTTNGAAEQNKAKNEAVYKAIESGNVSGLDSIISKEAVDHSMPGGGEAKGDSIIAMLANMHNSFSDLKMEVVADAAEGDYVFTLVRMTGTTNGNPAMGMPPNTKMDSKSVDVVKFKDGKAVEHWGFEDPKEMMKMMNMGPNKMGEQMENKMATKKDTMMKK
jgi:Predicted ester cyclase